MEDEKFEMIDDYILVRDLGQGANSIIKLGQNRLTGNYYAIKFCRPDDLIKKQLSNYKAMKNEAKILSRLHHDNIINLVEIKEQSGKIFYTVLELAEEGVLFEYLSQTGGFSEQIARTLFHQLIEGLSYCHSQQITHRDIKLENILLDKNFVLKLADFGFAAPTSGKNESGFNNSWFGSPAYLAPEIEQKFPYKGELADIFASGVVLFNMYSGQIPFEQDDYYRLIIKQQVNKFWQAHSRFKPLGFFSDEFKDLVSRMIAYNPDERITMEQIKMHPWFTGTIISQEQVITEFKLRKQFLSTNQ